MYLGFWRKSRFVKLRGVGVLNRLNGVLQKFDGSMEIFGLRPKTGWRFFWEGA